MRISDWSSDVCSSDLVPDDSVHVAAINRLADAGITLGTGPSTFEPAVPVTREQMSSFIARAQSFLTGTPFPVPELDHFVDVVGVHRANVNAVAGAGIAVGDGGRTEERRVGEGWGRTGRHREWTDN